MSERKSIYHRLDREFFSLIDKIKENENYHQFIEFLGTLEDNQFKAFKIIFNLLCLIIPLTPAFFLYLQLENKNVELAQREEIIRNINDIITVNLDINQNAKRILINNPNPDNSYVRQRFSSVAGSLGIDSANVRIGNVEVNNLSDKIVESQISFNLVNLSNDQMFQFLSQIVSTEKVILEKIDIRKNSANNLLEGNLTGFMYAQANNNE